MTALGWGPVALVVASVAITIAVSVTAARLLGFQGLFGPAHRRGDGDLRRFGGTGAVGSTAGPPAEGACHAVHRDRRVGAVDLRDGAYPMIVHALGLNPHAGILLGGTTQDEAQAVVAGYSLSPETGDAATLVKLLRVAMLLPVIVLASRR